MENDEKMFLKEFQKQMSIADNKVDTSFSLPDYPYTDAIYKGLGISDERAEAILRKWSERGWYHWSCNKFSGWITPAGRKVEV